MSIPIEVRRVLPWPGAYRKSLLEPPRQGEPDIRPFCIYTEEEAEYYFSLPKDQQQGWQSYCTQAAKEFNDANSYDKQVHLYHQWRPELSIRSFIRQQYGEGG